MLLRIWDLPPLYKGRWEPVALLMSLFAGASRPIFLPFHERTNCKDVNELLGMETIKQKLKWNIPDTHTSVLLPSQLTNLNISLMKGKLWQLSGFLKSNYHQGPETSGIIGVKHIPIAYVCRRGKHKPWWHRPLLPSPNGETNLLITSLYQLLRAKSDKGKSMATSRVIDEVLIHTFISRDFPRFFAGEFTDFPRTKS